MPLDIIILLLVVVIIFQKLRSLLGTRTENTSTPISKEGAEKIFDILMKENMRKQEKDGVINGGELQSEPAELSETEKVLRKIPDFDREKFLKGAQKAFEIIINAFAKGDIRTLSPLIATQLMAEFTAIINQRKADKITAETDLIGFNTVEIVAAKIEGVNALVSVRFVTEQANVIRNAQGEVLEGDENFIQSITDVWTFQRNVNFNSPVWLLVSTKK